MCFREQRQKDSVKMAANSFPRDMDYRQEALQDKATTSKLNQVLDLELDSVICCCCSFQSPVELFSNTSVYSNTESGLFASTEAASGDQSTASNSGHSSSSSQSLSLVSGALGSTTSTMSSSTSTSSGQVPQTVQSPSPALLQDPALLHQLLPALQATLQMNNGSMDMAKLNEGKPIKDEGDSHFHASCCHSLTKENESTKLVVLHHIVTVFSETY